jgi:MFS family permease
VTEGRLGDNAMLPPSLFASRSVVGANLFTALLYGPLTVMLTLIPFVMIRGAHLPTLVAGLAFIPLQVLITVVSPLAGMLCRRFGRRLPLFAGGAVVALGCAMALRIGPNATYWADIFPSILLLALGMSLAIAPLTTVVLTSVESDRAGTASGVNSAVSGAGSLFAIALLGGVLQQGGPQLFSGFHMAISVAAVACVVATLAVFIIEPGPKGPVSNIPSAIWARSDRIAEPALYHSRDPGLLSGRFRARLFYGRVALDAGARSTARRNPDNRYDNSARKPALARRSRPIGECRPGAAALARCGRRF